MAYAIAWYKDHRYIKNREGLVIQEFYLTLDALIPTIVANSHLSVPDDPQRLFFPRQINEGVRSGPLDFDNTTHLPPSAAKHYVTLLAAYHKENAVRPKNTRTAAKTGDTPR